MSFLLPLSCLHPDKQIFFNLYFIDESNEVLVKIKFKNLILDTLAGDVLC